VLSLSVGGLDANLLAFSNSNSVVIWDIRTEKPLVTFDELHTDDVTQVRFGVGDIVMSGSTDGLICLFNYKLPSDDALLSVFNVGQPVSKFGLFGRNSEFLYSLSTVESFSLFDINQEKQIGNFPDVRNADSQSGRIGGPVTLDYLIDCHYDLLSDSLFLLAGTNNGDVSIFHVDTNSVRIVQTLSGQHSSVVRASYWDIQANLLVTGGEDALITIWGSLPSSQQVSEFGKMKVKKPSRKPY